MSVSYTHYVFSNGIPVKDVTEIGYGYLFKEREVGKSTSIHLAQSIYLQ